MVRNVKKQGWSVHKFGGTSLADAKRFEAVSKIVDESGEPRKAVVVSAMAGITDVLSRAVLLAQSRDDGYRELLSQIRERHSELIGELLGSEARASELLEVLDTELSGIHEVLRGIWHTRSVDPRSEELVTGHGELWSSRVLRAFLEASGKPCGWLDAREVLVVRSGETGVIVDWKESTHRLKKWMEEQGSELVVITGFIASTADGIPTTLKRNGSDYSASIFANLLDADSVVIWTDVDGVMSADPRLVPDALVLDELSYDEVAELAYFGAKIVHPSTMAPAISKKIPIWIKNSLNPSASGTKIHSEASDGRPTKGFSTIKGVALLNVEGTGMMGVPGVAQRLFGSIREVGVSVIMISQASSEHSICFAVPGHQAKLAKETVEKCFQVELSERQIQTVDVKQPCCILAMVGEGMAEKPGMAGAFFKALGDARINVRAIAQGSSERNISAVIDESDAQRALRIVHSAFYLSPQTLSVGIIGPGLIGKTLLKQIGERADSLRRERGIDLRIRGIMNRSRMLLDERGIDPHRWNETLLDQGKVSDLSKFVEHVRGEHLPHAVLIDATASAEIADAYPQWLSRGIHIITPNKKANTASMDFYRELKLQIRDSGKRYLYETTVGAGLPVIQTLQELVQTGDKVLHIEGVFSGTLAYIFNSFNSQAPFSAVVKQALEKGYTEPDPRDDLSGTDVARKLIILAREMGMEVELGDVSVESLVPESLRKLETQDYLDRLSEFDEPMSQRLNEAESSGGVLRYVGSIDAGSGEAKVGLQIVPATHPFARIRGSDNIVAYTTERYLEQPLIVQGPGAGPEVTAAGVFADLLRLGSYLGAPL